MGLSCRIPANYQRLRVHSSHEWHDLYSQSCGDELKKFYDRYLKGVQNDWESTPQLRISLLQYNKVTSPPPLQDLERHR